MEVRCLWRLDVRRPLGCAFVPDHSNVRFPVSSPTWLRSGLGLGFGFGLGFGLGLGVR